MKSIYCFVCRSKKKHLLFKKDKYNIFKCLNCGFVYTNPTPSKVQLGKFYKNFDYNSVVEAEKVIRKDAVRSLKNIEKHQPQGRLVDLGCGRGFFMDEARRRGWDVHGIDYSSKVIEYAINNLELNVEQADIFAFKTKKKFDVITLNQIIEHFFNPDKLIKKCSKLLKENGILYIATPNIGSISAKILGGDFDHLIPPWHLGYFDKNTLAKLLKANNFNVLDMRSWSYSVDLAGIIKRLIYKNRHSAGMSMNRSINPTSLSNQSKIKLIKYFLFDKLFCGLFYRFLNLDSFGSILEVIAIKE